MTEPGQDEEVEYATLPVRDLAVQFEGVTPDEGEHVEVGDDGRADDADAGALPA